MAKIRKARKLSQAQLAALVGVEQPTISRMERGDEGVTLRQVKAVAAALDVSLCEIFASEREAQELALIEAFRSLPSERQAGWLDLARAIATPSAE